MPYLDSAWNFLYNVIKLWTFTFLFSVLFSLKDLILYLNKVTLFYNKVMSMFCFGHLCLYVLDHARQIISTLIYSLSEVL